MSDTGRPVWILLFATGLVPLATAGELVAAIFSKRVRAFIAKHPIAHFFWFAFTLLCIGLLIPARSGPHHRF
jgi:hypothetical protein